MRSTVEALEGNKVKLAVQLDEAEFERAVDAAFRKIAREVRVPGFRPGKAPRKVLESRLGAKVGREQAMQDGLADWYAAAVREHDVDVIAPPQIDIIAGQDQGPVSFDAVVEVRPTVQVAGYASLRVELERPALDERAVQAQIDRMRQLEATFAPVQRPAADGDAVTIDLVGSLDGEPQPGLRAQDYSYSVGSGAVTPELDQRLRGARPGDILEFEATHPDPGESRRLTFRVLVKEVNEAVLPELDDEWVRQVSDFSTVEELRADLARRMAAVRRAQARASLRERVGEALVRLVEAEPPEALVSAEMEDQVQTLLLRLKAQGTEFEQWLAESGMSRAAFTASVRDAATRAVQVDLALRAVADAEGIEVGEEDLAQELEAVAQRVGSSASRVRQHLERGGQLSAVRSDLRKRKALEWLLERVEIVDPEGKPIDRAEIDQVSEDGSDEDDGSDEGDEGTTARRNRGAAPQQEAGEDQ